MKHATLLLLSSFLFLSSCTVQNHVGTSYDDDIYYSAAQQPYNYNEERDSIIYDYSLRQYYRYDRHYHYFVGYYFYNDDIYFGTPFCRKVVYHGRCYYGPRACSTREIVRASHARRETVSSSAMTRSTFTGGHSSVRGGFGSTGIGGHTSSVS